jgi:hypothetical protein
MALIQGIVEAFRKYETLCTMVDGIRARRRWLVTVVKAPAFGEVVFFMTGQWRKLHGGA